MPKSMQPTTIIYALIDPRDHRTRYIGRSVNPAKRLLGHFGESRLGGSKKGPWLRELMANGLTPHLEIIEEVEAERGEAVEKEWIRRYRAIEPELLNAHDCQSETEGWKMGLEWRRAQAHPTAMTPEEVRSFRLSRGLSQAKLAKMLGVHYAAVSLWESGKRKVSPTVRLALERLAEDGT